MGDVRGELFVELSSVSCCASQLGTGEGVRGQLVHRDGRRGYGDRTHPLLQRQQFLFRSEVCVRPGKCFEGTESDLIEIGAS
jgi:hypothetical protein